MKNAPKAPNGLPKPNKLKENDGVVLEASKERIDEIYEYRSYQNICQRHRFPRPSPHNCIESVQHTLVAKLGNPF